jgi:5-oxoprolinase (ATP-hydrolysing) subunit C
MSLRVLEPGLLTLVVDRGRPSSRHLGVPLGGAADRTSFLLGNALVGNPPDAAVLEICLAGPTLQATCDIGCALAGAPFDVQLGNERLLVGRSFVLHAGQTLRVAGTKVGMRTYLCVRGGLQEPLVLGSRSGLESIRRGQELHCSPSQVRPRSFGDEKPQTTWMDGTITLRALPGPQADWFDLKQFFGPTYRVTPTSNRMGLRLAGETLVRPVRELLSEPVAPGTVQVVNDGQCIVLGVDGQTIGGYPKVAQVIDADLDYLGQARPGQEVRFANVAMDQAEAAFEARERELNEWLTRLSLSR